MKPLIELFATVINKLTLTKQKTSSIPRHRLEACHGHDSEHRRRQISSDIAYCRDLQNKIRREKAKLPLRRVRSTRFL